MTALREAIEDVVHAVHAGDGRGMHMAKLRFVDIDMTGCRMDQERTAKSVFMLSVFAGRTRQARNFTSIP